MIFSCLVFIKEIVKSGKGDQDGQGKRRQAKTLVNEHVAKCSTKFIQPVLRLDTAIAKFTKRALICLPTEKIRDERKQQGKS